MAAVAPARAAQDEPPVPTFDVGLACVREADDDAATGADDGDCGDNHPGLVAWLGEVRRRTSVAAAFAPRRTRWRDGPPAEPIVLWTGSARPRPLSADERRSLRQFLSAGGSLWVDAEDPRAEAPFVAAVRAELVGLFGAEALAPVAPGHVLYRSFYLAAPPRGRAAASATPEGLRLHGRLAAVLLQHDLFGALAARVGGAPARTEDEGDVRFAVNWLMYALCGDYKDDHVHLPYILKRRG